MLNILFLMLLINKPEAWACVGLEGGESKRFCRDISRGPESKL